MKTFICGALLLCACSGGSDDSGAAAAGAGGGGASHSGGTGGSGAGSSHAGSSNGGGDIASAGDDGESNAGAGGDIIGEAGAAGATGQGVAGAGGDDTGPANSCSAARSQLLGSIDSVATGDVSVVSNTAGVATVYVNATAGGTAAAAMNPWIFVAFEGFSKVQATDVSAVTSTAWDLAIKRPLLYTNSGDGGPGDGGAALISKDFASVTAADAVGVSFASEKFFDAECNPNLDPTGAALTSFAAWYDYDANTHVLSPHPGTWLVHGATGKLFKLRVETYYGTSDGGTGMAGGAYLLEIGAL